MYTHICKMNAKLSNDVFLYGILADTKFLITFANQYAFTGTYKLSKRLYNLLFCGINADCIVNNLTNIK